MAGLAGRKKTAATIIVLILTTILVHIDGDHKNTVKSLHPLGNSDERTNMKCNARIRLQSALAITVFGCNCASLTESFFIPYGQNNFVMNSVQAIRRTISSMGHLSLNMVEDRDYISPMRQRKRFSSPCAPFAVDYITYFSHLPVISFFRTTSHGRRCSIYQREFTTPIKILQ
jgi:hypothetical protein